MIQKILHFKIGVICINHIQEYFIKKVSLKDCQLSTIFCQTQTVWRNNPSLHKITRLSATKYFQLNAWKAQRLGSRPASGRQCKAWVLTTARSSESSSAAPRSTWEPSRQNTKDFTIRPWKARLGYVLYLWRFNSSGMCGECSRLVRGKAPQRHAGRWYWGRDPGQDRCEPLGGRPGQHQGGVREIVW